MFRQMQARRPLALSWNQHLRVLEILTREAEVLSPHRVLFAQLAMMMLVGSQISDAMAEEGWSGC